MENFFVEEIFCGEVSDSCDKENLEECIGDSGAVLRITYMNNSLTDVEEFNIDVIVVNGQKMKCELIFTVNLKL